MTLRERAAQVDDAIQRETAIGLKAVVKNILDVDCEPEGDRVEIEGMVFRLLRGNLVLQVGATAEESITIDNLARLGRAVRTMDEKRQQINERLQRRPA